MNITDVRVRKVTKEGKMKAVVSITIDDEFVVHDIKVIEGEKGLFIAMPSRKATDGEKKECPRAENGSGYVFRPGAFLSVKTKMTIYKSISPSFYEGGDSEWFINYPSFIIKGICEQSVSKF